MVNWSVVGGAGEVRVWYIEKENCSFFNKQFSILILMLEILLIMPVKVPVMCCCMILRR